MENQNVNDPKLQWIMLDAEYNRRIENPRHYEMHDYIRPFVSQEDYNFFMELSKIKDEYFDWQADVETIMDYPAVIANQEMKEKFVQIGRLLSHAFQKSYESTPGDCRIHLSMLFKMNQSAKFILN
jgi:hypothetical protein